MMFVMVEEYLGLSGMLNLLLTTFDLLSKGNFLQHNKYKTTPKAKISILTPNYYPIPIVNCYGDRQSQFV